MSDLTNFNILINNQFGFRNTYSTAFLKMVDKISDAINNKYYSLSVFIDLSKALNTLDINILLGKLDYGIRGTALMWFKSYLHNRSQLSLIMITILLSYQ